MLPTPMSPRTVIEPRVLKSCRDIAAITKPMCVSRSDRTIIDVAFINDSVVCHNPLPQLYTVFKENKALL